MPPLRAEEHQASQEAVAALIVPLLRRSWDLLDLSNLPDTLPRFREAVGAVVNHYGRGAAAVAAQHYTTERHAAGVPGRIALPPVPDVPEGFIDQLIVEKLAEAEADVAKALEGLDAGAEQLVLDQGRRQMLSAVALDREAKGWARIPNAGACSFCLMLALRAGAGYLYTSKRAANFRAHENCRCSVEPVFGRFEPTAQVRDAEKVWADTTKGRSGHDARVAFRQALEGRDVTGAKKVAGKHKTLTKGEGKTPENQRAQLRILEAMPPAKTPAAAQWRVDRIAEIRKYLGA